MDQRVELVLGRVPRRRRLRSRAPARGSSRRRSPMRCPGSRRARRSRRSSSVRPRAARRTPRAPRPVEPLVGEAVVATRRAARPPGAARPRRYLPVSSPLSSGKYGHVADPELATEGQHVRVVLAVHEAVVVLDRDDGNAGGRGLPEQPASTLERPSQRTFPSSTSSRIAPSVSAIGVTPSGRW